MRRLNKLVACLAEPLYRRALFVFRVAAGVEHTPVLSGLPDIHTVVDIGANRGQFALVVRRCFSNAKIISMEPLPGPAALFRRIFLKDTNVSLFESAIGPVKEERTMHVSSYDDSSSLLPISSLQTSVFPGTDEVDTIDVWTAPLHDFVHEKEIVSPALLKLDVQGFELDALRGCESLLSRFDWIYCECSFVELYVGQKLAADVIDWLSVKGFRVAGIYNPAYDNKGMSIQVDILFTAI